MSKQQKHTCFVCNVELSAERVEALEMLGTPMINWACVKHSQTKPKQAIYSGEVGTSDLIFCDKIYDDSVRSVFKSSTTASEVPEDEEAPVSAEECISDDVDIVKRSDL